MKDLSNENVIHVKNNNLEFLQFRKLLEYSDIISHAYGIGRDVNYRTNSLNKKLTEEEINVAKINYKKLCEQIGLMSQRLVKAKQRHTDEIFTVNTIEDYNKIHDKDNFAMDGLCTDKPDIILGTTNADCILMILFDHVKKVLANVHSGWRGTLQRISVKTVNKMKEEYGCNPENIICCMAPSIRKCHFEVEKDVMELFKNEFEGLPQISEIIEEKIKGEKWNIDTILINHLILEQVGLKPENIIDSGICSVCESDLMHSYRVERENYGLNTLIAQLNNR